MKKYISPILEYYKGGKMRLLGKLFFVVYAFYSFDGMLIFIAGGLLTQEFWKYEYKGDDSVHLRFFQVLVYNKPMGRRCQGSLWKVPKEVWCWHLHKDSIFRQCVCRTSETKNYSYASSVNDHEEWKDTNS